MSDETKFPESFRAAEDPHGMNVCDVYDFGEVMYWFQRCLDDLPYGTYKLETFGQKAILWIEKWFSQFKEKNE